MVTTMVRLACDFTPGRPMAVSSLAPGQEGEIVWKFSQAGVVNFACLMPGHYEAGMRGMVKVGGKPSSKKTADHSEHKH